MPDAQNTPIPEGYHRIVCVYDVECDALNVDPHDFAESMSDYHDHNFVGAEWLDNVKDLSSEIRATVIPNKALLEAFDSGGLSSKEMADTVKLIEILEEIDPTGEPIPVPIPLAAMKAIIDRVEAIRGGEVPS